MKKEMQNGRGRYVMTAKELCYIALGTTLLTVCSWIALPMGDIPITLQTLALFWIVGALGTRRAVVAVFAYLTLGFCGVPVFASLTGGIGKLFAPTGGFLIGFLVATPLMGGLYRGRLWQKAIALGSGMLVYNAFAIVWFCVLYTSVWTGGVWTAIIACVLPYLPFDLIKIAVAIFLIERLKKRIVRI